MNDKRGSIWRKWDLHIHSNASDGKMSPEEIILKAKDLSIDVVALTDHHTAKNIDSIISLGDANGISVIPGVEFRTEYGDKSVHLIGLFPRIYKDIRVTGKVIEDLILSPLSISQTSIIAKGKIKLSSEQINNPTDEEAFKAGMFLVQVDFRKASDLIHNELGGLVVVHAGNKSNSLDREMKHEGKPGVTIYNSLGPVKEELFIEGYIDICEIKNSNDDRDFYLDKFGRPSITASDAHELNEIGTRYCWIKADPTFEGLRQILYEPEERIKIQERNPENDYIRPFFSKITIAPQSVFIDSEVSFAKAEIPLNRGMVAIIGGRGTGKSLLFDCIFKTLDRNLSKDERISRIKIHDGFEINYSKDNFFTEQIYKIEDENIVPFLHVTQGEVKGIVHPPENMYKEIFAILDVDIDLPYKVLDQNITNLFSEMNSLKRWLDFKDSDQRVNSIEFNEKKKNESEKFIEALTTSNNQRLITSCRNNKNLIGNNSQQIELLQQILKDIRQFTVSVNEKINTIKENQTFKIPLINLGDQISKIETALQIFNERQETLNQENEKIERDFRTQGIEGDVTTLLEKIELHSNQIQNINSHLAKIKLNEEKYSKLLALRNNFASELIRSLHTQRIKLKKKWTSLQKGKEGWLPEQLELIKQLLKDIEINITIQFDEKLFVKGLQDILNGNKFRKTGTSTTTERIASYFSIHNWVDFFNFLRNKPVFKDDQGKYSTLDELLVSEYVPYNQIDRFLSYLYESNDWNKYLKLIPEVKYKGKTPDKLSVGQRGTLFICLKLAKDAFFTPFIFDQPEDDLDNDFIMNELVPIFRIIKKYRQVIIITHNANLVVNADAEQVIVAYNNEENIQYISGSLEHTFAFDDTKSNPLEKRGIREHVCQILEGGRTAFEKREQKYGFR